MQVKSRVFTLTASILLAFCVASQPSFAGDAQHWEVVSATVDLGDGWRASGESILRFSQSRGFYELEQNAMLGHTLDPLGVKGVTVWLGYTHDPNYSHGNFTVMEHRFRQQVSFDRLLTIGRATVSGRLRLEERWREGQTGTGWRLRPYAKLNVPLRGPVALVATHESFIDFNDTGFQKVGGEERMRDFAGVNLRLTRRASVELGYLNQHGFVPGGPDTNDHIGSLELKAAF